MSEDLHRITRAAYEATVDRYRRRWQGTDPLLEAKQRFAERLAPQTAILDVGCGPGRDLAWFSQAGYPAVGVDVSPSMLRVCVPGLSVVAADVRRLPFATNTFGGWWASASLLHLKADELPAVLAELQRVSRQGAIGFLSVKEGDGDELKPVGVEAHARYFCYWTATRLDAVIRQAGLVLLARETVEDSLGRRPWLHRLVRVQAP